MPSSNLGRTCCVQKLFLTFRKFLYTARSPHVLQKEELLTKIYLYSKILSNQEEEEPLIFEKTSNMTEENNGPTILVTGGAGYIGTHCIIELLQKDYNVVAIDNFTNSVKGENGKKSLFDNK